jgi:hypothetical protein
MPGFTRSRAFETIRIAAPHSIQTTSIMGYLGLGLSIILFISEVQYLTWQ